MNRLLLVVAIAVGATPALAGGFTVTSPEIANGGAISLAQVLNRFGCDGQNRSPSLSRSGEPAGTQSFAVTLFDPDAPTDNGFWHWTVFNISPTVHQLAGAAGTPGSTTLPAGAGEGRNDFGFSYYSGPCPPPGPPHHYHITVYAVKTPKLPLDGNSSGAVVAATLRSNSLANAEIVGVYARSR